MGARQSSATDKALRYWRRSGNVTKAAKAAGVSRRTLQRAIKRAAK